MSGAMDLATGAGPTTQADAVANAKPGCMFGPIYVVDQCTCFIRASRNSPGGGHEDAQRGLCCSPGSLEVPSFSLLLPEAQDGEDYGSFEEQGCLPRSGDLDRKHSKAEKAENNCDKNHGPNVPSRIRVGLRCME